MVDADVRIEDFVALEDVARFAVVNTGRFARRTVQLARDTNGLP